MEALGIIWYMARGIVIIAVACLLSAAAFSLIAVVLGLILRLLLSGGGAEPGCGAPGIDCG